MCCAFALSHATRIRKTTSSKHLSHTRLTSTHCLQKRKPLASDSPLPRRFGFLTEDNSAKRHLSCLFYVARNSGSFSRKPRRLGFPVTYDFARKIGTLKRRTTKEDKRGPTGSFCLLRSFFRRPSFEALPGLAAKLSNRRGSVLDVPAVRLMPESQVGPKHWRTDGRSDGSADRAAPPTTRPSSAQEATRHPTSGA